MSESLSRRTVLFGILGDSITVASALGLGIRFGTRRREASISLANDYPEIATLYPEIGSYPVLTQGLVDIEGSPIRWFNLTDGIDVNEDAIQGLVTFYRRYIQDKTVHFPYPDREIVSYDWSTYTPGIHYLMAVPQDAPEPSTLNANSWQPIDQRAVLKATTFDLDNGTLSVLQPGGPNDSSLKPLNLSPIAELNTVAAVELCNATTTFQPRDDYFAVMAHDLTCTSLGWAVGFKLEGFPYSDYATWISQREFNPHPKVLYTPVTMPRSDYDMIPTAQVFTAK